VINTIFHKTPQTQFRLNTIFHKTPQTQFRLAKTQTPIQVCEAANNANLNQLIRKEL